MEKTLKIINQLEEEAIIGQYAIGGAVAATFYIEPATTYDVDIFLSLAVGATGLVTLTPIYDFLAQAGYREHEGEAVLIEGWPVQFLPVFNPLLEEALREARSIRVHETPTRIFTAEHLAAIMLDTGRPKDIARLAQFLNEKVLDMARFHEILIRHSLTAKWEKFVKQFPESNKVE